MVFKKLISKIKNLFERIQGIQIFHYIDVPVLYDRDDKKSSDDILFMKNSFGLEFEEWPLKIYLKGKELENISDDVLYKIQVYKNLIMIIHSGIECNIHAYDLNGNLVWDIEPYIARNGNEIKYFVNLGNIGIDREGKEWLHVHNFPNSYVTDPLTGKGTRFWQREETGPHNW